MRVRSIKNDLCQKEQLFLQPLSTYNFPLANGFQFSLFILTEISGFEIQICGGGAT
jgi:hypothetical protein